MNLEKIIRIATLCLLITSPCSVFAAPGDNPVAAYTGVKWEYLVINEDNIGRKGREDDKDNIAKGFDMLGQEGWELVTVTPGIIDPVPLNNAHLSSRVYGLAPPFFYFKRVKK